MLIKSLVLKKEFLTTVKETVTLEEALKILEDSGFRCVPILDESGTIFRGNIYKMHIYRHKSQGGDMSLPVTYLLKNATKTIPVKIISVTVISFLSHIYKNVSISIGTIILMTPDFPCHIRYSKKAP